MLIPISMIKSIKNITESYNLYDVETGKVSNWTARKIKKALEEGYDIRGLVGTNPRLSSYFSNIGVAGENIGGRQYYTVVKRRLYNNKTMFTVVDVVGKDYEFEKKEIIKFIQDGAVVAGVHLDKVLRVSMDIQTKFIK